MARIIKFKSAIQRQTYLDFLLYLGLYIPVYRMPASKYYSQFNTTIKSFINKSDEFENIESIIDIDDVDLLCRILISIQSRYAYVRKDDKKTEGLKYYIDFLKEREKNIESNTGTILVEQNLSEEYKEGGVLDCHGDKYERNHKAREECLKYYGYNCRVCGFDFEERYGTRGRKFIEVHHRVPLSERKEEYNVDPIRDLIPVCPNCHAMLHRTKPAITVEELISLINKNDL